MCNEGCSQCGRRIVGDGTLCAECQITWGRKTLAPCEHRFAIYGAGEPTVCAVCDETLDA